MKASGASAFNVLENNGSAAHQAVPHVHFHIIPKPDENSGLAVRWKPKPMDPAAGAELARTIASELG
jgi:diadenosine tetraphosphate (Ap4A) HIT family hydrolase